MKEYNAILRFKLLNWLTRYIKIDENPLVSHSIENVLFKLPMRLIK